MAFGETLFLSFSIFSTRLISDIGITTFTKLTTYKLQKQTSISLKNIKLKIQQLQDRWRTFSLIKDKIVLTHNTVTGEKNIVQKLVADTGQRRNAGQRKVRVEPKIAYLMSGPGLADFVTGRVGSGWNKNCHDNAVFIWARSQQHTPLLSSRPSAVVVSSLMDDFAFLEEYSTSKHPPKTTIGRSLRSLWDLLTSARSTNETQMIM